MALFHAAGRGSSSERCCRPEHSRAGEGDANGFATAVAVGAAAADSGRRRHFAAAVVVPLSASLCLLCPRCRDMRLRQERQAAAAAAQEENVKGWDPAKDPNVEVRKSG